jgi:hypothetical protein
MSRSASLSDAMFFLAQKPMMRSSSSWPRCVQRYKMRLWRASRDSPLSADDCFVLLHTACIEG